MEAIDPQPVQTAEPAAPPAASRRGKRSRRPWYLGWQVILLFSLLAAARILVYASAVPFFSSLDERAHFDSIIRYSHGQLPRRGQDRYSRETAEVIALYASPQTLGSRDHAHRVWYRTPRWTLPPEQQKEVLDYTVGVWTNTVNYQSFSTPAYYPVAAAWYHLGKAMGLRPPELLYWLRFLNAPIYAGFIWLAWWFVRTHHGQSGWLEVGVPMMLALMPQDVYYALNSDVLSAPTALLALHWMLRWRREPGMGVAIAAGVATSVAMLVKYSNIAIPVAMFAVLAAAWLGRHAADAGAWRRRRSSGLAMLVSSALPIGLWFAWMALQGSELTGTSHKKEFFGWSVKPLLDWVDHPVFTPRGLLGFLFHVCSTFWRGEEMWYLRQIRSFAVDAIYFGTTALFLIAAVATLVRGGRAPRARAVIGDDRFPWFLHVLVVVTSVCFLAGISLPFNFGKTWYPSEEFPFFGSGRLILCCMPSLALLYYLGAARLTGWRVGAVFFVVGAVLVVATVSEAALTVELFGSPFNLYHRLAVMAGP